MYILDLYPDSKNLELILDFFRGLFTLRLKRTRGLLCNVKFDFKKTLFKGKNFAVRRVREG